MGLRAIPTIIAAALFSCLSTGCASRRVTIPYFESHDNPPIRQAKPMLAASINGVSGHFLIDTGAACSILTMTAARSCALGVSPSEDRASSIGSEVALLQTTNVTIKLAPDVDIHWRSILVLPDEADKQIQTDTNVFGILGYPTLAARHTVIDMKRKTLTMTPNHDWGNSLMMRDVAAFSCCLAEEWVLTFSDGSLVTKPMALADLKEGALKIESFQLDNVEVRVYGETAIVFGVITERSKFRDEDTSGKRRFTDVFVKRDGRWQAVASHETNLLEKKQ